MKKLSFELNQKQYNALNGLAYHIADNAYMLERYGADETRIERAENHKTITMLFDELDTMQVPFWLQNTVICKFENWRLYLEESLYSVLKNTPYNITFTASVL